MEKYDVEGLKKTIREFIIENFLFGKIGDFKDDMSLLDVGIIDSTGIIELVEFMEETWDLTVEDEYLAPEFLDSVNDIVTCYLIPELKRKDKVTS